MDQTERAIIEFTQQMGTFGLAERTQEGARLRLLDSIGCAMAVPNALPVRALSALAPKVRDGGTAIWGTTDTTTPDHAALLNGAMIRYLDMNDAYFMRSTAHPSDNIGAILAAAEMMDGTLADVFRGIVISYEVQCRFCDVAPFHQNGWDQTTSGTPGAAMAAASLLGLSPEQTRHALAISVTPNLPTYQTRTGNLSNWKGLAGPFGASTGLFASMMAREAITGPEASFDGPYGVWAQTLGQRLEVPLPTALDDHVFAVEQSDIKFFPIRIACQLPTLLALDLRDAIGDDEVTAIEVWTDTHSFGKQSKDPALWKPTTRESADHSLPFCIATALLDGDISVDTFRQDRFLDNDVLNLIDKLSIEFDPDFSDKAPATRSCRLVVEMENGQRHERSLSLAPDDPERRPDKTLLIKKAIDLMSRRASRRHAEEIVGEIMDLPLNAPAKKIAQILSTID